MLDFRLEATLPSREFSCRCTTAPLSTATIPESHSFYRRRRENTLLEFFCLLVAASTFLHTSPVSRIFSTRYPHFDSIIWILSWDLKLSTSQLACFCFPCGSFLSLFFPVVNINVMCKYTDDIVIHPFGFRTHAHGLGTVISVRWLL